MDVQKGLTALLAGTFAGLIIIAAVASFHAPRLSQDVVVSVPDPGVEPTASPASESPQVESSSDALSGGPAVTPARGYWTRPSALATGGTPAPDEPSRAAVPAEQLKGAYDAHSRVLAVLAIVAPLITTVVGFFFGQKVGQQEGQQEQRIRVTGDLQDVLNDRAVASGQQYEERIAGLLTRLR